MLSRFAIAFFPRSKCLFISWLQLPSAVILEPKKIKSVTASTFSPSVCHEVIGLDAMILVFWTLSFKPVFLLSFFTLIRKLFSSSSLSAVRVMSSTYLRLLLFLLGILIPAWNSSSLAFHMMYSAYKLNKQGDNIQPYCTPFPVLSQSVVSCNILTAVCVSYSLICLRPHGLYPARLLCPWNSPGKNTGVGCHSLLQGIVVNGSPTIWEVGGNWCVRSIVGWKAESCPRGFQAPLASGLAPAFPVIWTLCVHLVLTDETPGTRLWKPTGVQAVGSPRLGHVPRDRNSGYSQLFSH